MVWQPRFGSTSQSNAGAGLDDAGWDLDPFLDPQFTSLMKKGRAVQFPIQTQCLADPCRTVAPFTGASLMPAGCNDLQTVGW